MSFQHFRLGELAMSQPLPPHLTSQHAQHASTSAPPNSQSHTTTSASAIATGKPSNKLPYGAGDTEDGYTLVFPNIDAFNAWREQEEERQMVEFVKGDTHGSKAVPPRFKDHTKLVCARHSRSGRKKYVKKPPERVRKVPSRKLDGGGCQASISYKTYFDKDEVRACYNSQHSHEIGLANLPFTRRGRKAAAQSDKGAKNGDSSEAPSPLTAPAVPQTMSGMANYQPAIGAMSGYSHQAQPYNHEADMARQRWDRMSILFNSIRDNARGFNYPEVSVAALETCLLRMYLESPVPAAAQPGVAPTGQHAANAASVSNGPGTSAANGRVNGAGSNGVTSGSEGS